MQGITRKILKNLICMANQESVLELSAVITLRGTCRMPPALTLQRKNRRASRASASTCRTSKIHHDTFYVIEQTRGNKNALNGNRRWLSTPWMALSGKEAITTAIATIWDRRKHNKYGLHHPHSECSTWQSTGLPYNTKFMNGKKWIRDCEDQHEWHHRKRRHNKKQTIALLQKPVQRK